MKRKSIKELRMDVGTGDGSYYLGKHSKYKTTPGDADSGFSRGMQQQVPIYDEEYEDEEDIELFENAELNTDIEGAKNDRAGTAALIGRVYRQKGSTKAAAEKTAKAAVSAAKAVKNSPKSFLSKIPGLAKIGAAAIPILDVGIATATIVSALTKINEFNAKFNKKLNLTPGSELPNYLVDANDREFRQLIDYIQQAFLADDRLKDDLREDFNDILQTFKDLIIVVCVAITPYITAAGGSVATPVVGGIVYIGTKASGITTAVAIHTTPVERILFELSSELLGALDKMFKVFESHEDFKSGQNKIQRDSLAYCFVSNFIQSTSRMGKLYNALYVNEATILDKVIDSTASAVEKMSEHNKNKYMLIINEVNAIDEFQNYSAEINAIDRKLARQSSKYLEKENVDDALEEFSGVAALGGSPVTPLGTDATGKRVTRRKEKARSRFVKTKSFPYKK